MEDREESAAERRSTYGAGGLWDVDIVVIHIYQIRAHLVQLQNQIAVYRAWLAEEEGLKATKDK